MLTGEQLRELGSKPVKVHVLKIEAWNGQEVAVQELDGLGIFEWERAGAERAQDPAKTLTIGTGAEVAAVLSVVECQFDADGKPVDGTVKRVFTSQPKDIVIVRKWGAALQELFAHLSKINRFYKQFEEDTRKNSSTTPSSDSGST